MVNITRLIQALLFHCLPVGRYFGIAVRIHWSFWILPIAFALMGLAHGPLNAALVALLVLVFFAQGVVLHEYGHALAARLFGVRTRDIILTPIGGVARMESMPENPIEEIVIALAGPAVNVIAAVTLATLLLVVGQPPQLEYLAAQWIRSWSDFAWWLLFLNVFMAAFNMLPAFPSDGGRVLRAMLALFVNRLTATQVAVGMGTIVALGIGFMGLVLQAPQLPVIAVLFAVIGQMELWMVRRQHEARGRIWAESSMIEDEYLGELMPPEPAFSGYAWDAASAAWVEWRGGVAVRKCRMRRS